MLIFKSVILMFLLVSANAGPNINHQYKWNQEVQFCSYTLSIFTEVICAYNYKQEQKEIEHSRFKRNLNNLEQLNIDCCEKKCTPLYILQHYCDNPVNIDTTQDLITMPFIHPDTLTMLTYCYMGLKKYCLIGTKNLIFDMINTYKFLQS